MAPRPAHKPLNFQRPCNNLRLLPPCLRIYPTILAGLNKSGCRGRSIELRPPPATRRDLFLCHQGRKGEAGYAWASGALGGLGAGRCRPPLARPPPSPPSIPPSLLLQQLLPLLRACIRSCAKRCFTNEATAPSTSACAPAPILPYIFWETRQTYFSYIFSAMLHQTQHRLL